MRVVLKAKVAEGLPLNGGGCRKLQGGDVDKRNLSCGAPIEREHRYQRATCSANHARHYASKTKPRVVQNAMKPLHVPLRNSHVPAVQAREVHCRS